jgi:hypothetical protein
MKSQTITIDRLHELLSYDPATGIFRWNQRMSNYCHAGRVAGHVNPHGYRAIAIDRCMYLAHRLAWFYVRGEWPIRDIDHINSDKLDNRICNLRIATESQNGGNSRLSKRNTSGFKGVYWNNDMQKWHAQIHVKRRRIHLGLFHTPQEAGDSYKKAALRYFGEFARF